MLKIFSILVLLIVFYSGQTAIALPMHITATTWLVADGEGRVIESQNTGVQRSIASITKLMTAMVVLDARQNLNEYIKPYTRRELIQLALVKSNNNAARILCKRYPGGQNKCIKAMNKKAHDLSMLNTRYLDSTGLNPRNVSTADDLVRLVLAAQDYPEIRRASQTAQIRIKIRKKWFIFNNTNPIIGKRHKFIVSKTGYIRASGGCIVMMLDTEIGRRIVVVLGSKNTKTRIPEAEFIATNN